MAKIKRTTIEPGIIERINASGSIVYEIQYRDTHGDVKKETIGPRLSDARKALTARKAARDKGDPMPRNLRLKFGEASRAWLETVQRRVDAGSLAPTTYSQYETLMRVHVEPLWGNRRLSTITFDDLMTLIEAKQIEGKKAQTIKNILNTINCTFKHASKRMGWNGTNPISLMDKGDRLRNDQEEIRALNQEECEKLLDQIGSYGYGSSGEHNPGYRTLISLALITGARKGEVLGLTWGNVDLENGVISIIQQYDPKGRFRPPKTESGIRDIKIGPKLVLMLKRHKQFRKSFKGDDDFVFCTKSGNAIDHASILRIVKACAKKAGIEPQPTFHVLRHSFASSWVDQNVGTIIELSNNAGHAKPSTTLDKYGHAIKSQARSEEIAKGMDELHGGAATS